MKTVTVNAAALLEVLNALNGPGHLIRELQYTRDLPTLSTGSLAGVTNPINTLIDEYNKAAENWNANAEKLKVTKSSAA